MYNMCSELEQKNEEITILTESKKRMKEEHDHELYRKGEEKDEEIKRCNQKKDEELRKKNEEVRQLNWYDKQMRLNKGSKLIRSKGNSTCIVSIAYVLCGIL